MRNASVLAQVNSLHQHLWASICECMRRAVSSTGPVFAKCPQRYHHCCQQCCQRRWFNHRLSMCRRRREPRAPRWSLCVAGRPHKSEAGLDQYVNKDDRLVPEKCLRCLAMSLHKRSSSYLHYSTTHMPVFFIFFLHPMCANVAQPVHTGPGVVMFVCPPHYVPHGHLSR